MGMTTDSTGPVGMQGSVTSRGIPIKVLSVTRVVMCVVFYVGGAL